MPSTRPERRSEQTATTVLLLMVLVLAASAATIERPTVRSGVHAPGGKVTALVNQPLSEAPPIPGSALLAPPSEIVASVGARCGSDVVVDLAHLAGTSMERERRQRDLPPPHRA